MEEPACISDVGKASLPSAGCAVCHNLMPETLQHLKPGQRATIFVDEYELLQSAQSTVCDECKLLFNAIGVERDKWASDKDHSSYIEIKLAVGEPVRISWSMKGIYRLIFRSAFGMTQEEEEARGLSTVIGRYPLVSEDSGSKTSLSLLKCWYEECKSSHNLCQLDSLSALPTRVIDVASGVPNDADVTLIETNGARGPYMALSYCWGDPMLHPALKTFRSNLSTFKDRVPYGTLPLTLQHCVTLARQLNLRYVWIDALCIIQDDNNDWMVEASRMCDVYSKAAITVVACRSDGSSGGIFGPQKYSTHTQTPYKQTLINFSEDHGRNHDPNPLLNDDDPIYDRAWAVQETILSGRAIFFSSKELRWECNTCRKCQCGKNSIQFASTLDLQEEGVEAYRGWRMNDFFRGTAIDAAYVQWKRMYVLYCSRELTKDSDRLPALSGLARRFSEIMLEKFDRKEQYLAGIWRGSLPQDLLWHVAARLNRYKKGGERQDRPKNWRAPTWSWASVEGDIQCSRYFEIYTDNYLPWESRVQVLDASTELAGSDPFGQVRAGPLNYLRLCGPMLRGISVKRLKMSFTFGKLVKVPEWGPFRHFISYRGRDLQTNEFHLDDLSGGEPEDRLQYESQNFAILIVGGAVSGEYHNCIVLKPVPGDHETFERVGMTTLGNHTVEPLEHQELINAAPRYTITLV